MSNVAEIASVARQVSAEEMARALQEAEIAALKQNIEVEAQMQQALIAMINDIMPHLGSNVNITA